MPVLNNVLAGAAGQSSGGTGDYEISRSLRFNNGTLYRDFSAGHHLKWTWAGWVKRSGLGSNFIFQGGNTDFNDDGLLFNSNNKLQITFHNGSNAVNGQLITSAKYVDCSAWMHICLVSDTGNSVGNDRMRLYVNGLRITEFDTNNNPNVATGSHDINKASRHHIGSFRGSSDMFLGMMADCYFLDGHLPATATDDASGSVTGTPNAEYLTDFGEFNDTTGVWDPKQYTFPSAVKHKGDWIGDTTGSPFNSNDDSQIHNVFDGAASSGAPAATSTAFVFTPSTPITGISKVRLKVQRDSQQTDDHDLKLNGTDIGSNWSLGHTNTVEFTVNNLTSIQWATKSNQHWYKLYTIEIYYDGAWHFLEQADKNNFHLDYSDNSGSHTLGNDVVGTNNWTTSGITRVRAATGNHGVTLGTSTLNYDPSVIFDGDISSAWVDRPINGNGVNFTGIPAANTQLRVRLHYIQSGTMTTNGGHQVATGNMNGAWIEPSGISYPFTLTSISVTGGNAGDGFGIGAIEVDGVVLDAGSGTETDSLLDSPTNYEASSGNNGGNYATLNPLSGNLTLSNGNLDSSSNYATWKGNPATFAVSSGKWYFESTVLSTNSGNVYADWGIVKTSNAAFTGQTVGDYGISYYGRNGRKEKNNTSATTSSSGVTSGDVVQVAFDLDVGKIWFGVNNTWIDSGNPSAGSNEAYTVESDTWVPAVAMFDDGTVATNFGQYPYSFAPPTGFKSICTQNLNDPLIADPSTAFDIQTYSGTGQSQTLGGLKFSADLFWRKCRSANQFHNLVDSVRGLSTALMPNGTYGDQTGQSNVSNVTSTGYDIGTEGAINTNGENYVAWLWDVGSSNTPISAGGLNSSLYNTSRRWSDGIANSSGDFDQAASNAFNGDRSNQLRTAGNSVLVTLNFSPALTVASTIEILAENYSTANFRYTVTVDGTTTTKDVVGNQPGTFNVSGSLTQITFDNNSSTGRTYLQWIKVDGKELIDDNVTPPNLPSIATTCRANQTAGVSIATYVGSGSNGSFAHNLNTEPKFVLVKTRTDGNVNWTVWHESLAATDYLTLNTSNAEGTAAAVWNSTAPTSAVVHVGSDVGTNKSSDNYVAYCFAPVDGYSAIGSYSSGSDPYIYTGFKPKFVILRRINTGGHWYVFDSERGPYNPNETWQEVNNSDTDQTHGNGAIHFLSNGFQPYGADVDASSGTYIYYAVADSPFKYARAR